MSLLTPVGLVLSVTKGKAGELEEVSAFLVGFVLVRPLCGLSGDGVRSLVAKILFGVSSSSSIEKNWSPRDLS